MEVKGDRLVCGPDGNTDPAPRSSSSEPDGSHPSRHHGRRLGATVKNGKEPHVFGLRRQRRRPDEVHIWKFADYEPQIGWDVCRRVTTLVKSSWLPTREIRSRTGGWRSQQTSWKKGLGLVD